MELDQFEGHTPGPLACVELMAFAAGFAVEDGEGRTVARIMKTHGVERLPSRANAALFAAAPELLAEVRRLTAEVGRLLDSREDEAERLDWLLARLPGSVIRDLVGVMSNTRDSGEWRALIDKAAGFKPHSPGRSGQRNG